MNPTHTALARLRHMRGQFWSWQLQALARRDLNSSAPAPGEPYAGEAQIASSASAAMSAFPYFAAETRAAKALAYVCGGAAFATVAVFGYSPGTVATSLGLVAAAALGVHHGWFRRTVPAVIDAEQLENARQQLKDSGDIYAEPLSLMEQIGLGAMLAIDGFLAGSALSNTAFAANFTPNIALAASAAWGLATSFLLWKAARAAATEVAINDRRTLIRNLLRSNQPDDQERASKLMQTIGPRLLGDYDRNANGKAARCALALIVLTLAGSIFVIRLSANPEETAVATGYADPVRGALMGRVTA